MPRLFLLLLATSFVSLFASCTGYPGSNGSDSALQLVATTGHISDALTRITSGVDVEIKLFCGPGVDPHSFSASTADVQAMENADAIFYNGFHLEAQLHDLLHHRYAGKSWAMASAFPENERLDWVEDGDIDPNAPYDPHIWNHLPAWAKCVEGLTEQMAEIDPDNAELYRKNGAEYVAEINEVHQWAKTELAKLPEDRRFLVSAHDAFNYFAKLYDLKTVAVLGVGNDPEADIQTMQEVAALIVEKKAPVIFMESITNPKVTTALKQACAARDWSVAIADQRLFSDDLGEDPPQDTYLGAFRSNVNVIFASLRK